MSVLVTIKFQGDTATFREAIAGRGDEFAKLGESARAAGSIHHRFGVGDGFVLVVDEWESPGHFEQFFGDLSVQSFIGSVGAAAVPPEVTVTEAVASPDQF
jgi:hypothetical protein